MVVYVFYGMRFSSLNKNQVWFSCVRRSGEFYQFFPSQKETIKLKYQEVKKKLFKSKL